VFSVFSVVKIIRAAPYQVKVLARMLIKQDEFARYSKSCQLNHGTKTLRSWDKSIETEGQDGVSERKNLQVFI